jgi:hypothetical protein
VRRPGRDLLEVVENLRGRGRGTARARKNRPDAGDDVAGEGGGGGAAQAANNTRAPAIPVRTSGIDEVLVGYLTDPRITCRARPPDGAGGSAGLACLRLKYALSQHLPSAPPLGALWQLHALAVIAKEVVH